jgi:hypothetical protein
MADGRRSPLDASSACACGVDGVGRGNPCRPRTRVSSRRKMTSGESLDQSIAIRYPPHHSTCHSYRIRPLPHSQTCGDGLVANRRLDLCSQPALPLRIMIVDIAVQSARPLVLRRSICASCLSPWNKTWGSGYMSATRMGLQNSDRMQRRYKGYIAPPGEQARPITGFYAGMQPLFYAVNGEEVIDIA